MMIIMLHCLEGGGVLMPALYHSQLQVIIIHYDMARTVGQHKQTHSYKKQKNVTTVMPSVMVKSFNTMIIRLN